MKNIKLKKYIYILICLPLLSCQIDSTILTQGLNSETENIEESVDKVSYLNKAKSISVNPSTLTLQAGSEKLLIPTIFMQDGKTDSTNKNIEWESEDPGIVTIDANGKLKGIRGGEAGIIAKVKNSDDVYTRVIVNVLSKKVVNKISVTPSFLNMKIGDNKDLTATVILSDNTKNGNVEWYSSDNTIATVSESGRVSAKNKGVTTIVATYKLDSSFKATVDINIDTQNNQVKPPDTIGEIVEPIINKPVDIIPSVLPIPSLPVVTVTPKPIPVTEEYVPAQPVLAKTYISEYDGNGDNIVNRGEIVYLKPTFTNIGKVSTNRLTVKLTSTSSFISSYNYYSVQVPAIKAGLTSQLETSSYNSFRVEVSKDTEPGMSIPITYLLSDDYGNKWEINDNIIIQ